MPGPAPIMGEPCHRSDPTVPRSPFAANGCGGLRARCFRVVGPRRRRRRRTARPTTKLAPVGARWSVSTVVGAAGEGGIRLGRDGRLAYPAGVAVLGPNRLAITSGRAVLGDNLP